jgi:glutamate---cysteine ligase / carboxylate-amine ligase
VATTSAQLGEDLARLRRTAARAAEASGVRLLATLIRAAVMTAPGEYDRVSYELDRIAAQGDGAMRQLRAWRKRGNVMDVIAEAAAATLS